MARSYSSYRYYCWINCMRFPPWLGCSLWYTLTDNNRPWSSIWIKSVASTDVSYRIQMFPHHSIPSSIQRYGWTLSPSPEISTQGPTKSISMDGCTPTCSLGYSDGTQNWHLYHSCWDGVWYHTSSTRRILLYFHRSHNCWSFWLCKPVKESYTDASSYTSSHLSGQEFNTSWTSKSLTCFHPTWCCSQPPYNGQYPVIERTDKYFVLQLSNCKDTVSVHRLKPAYMESNNTPATTQVTPTQPKTPAPTTTNTSTTRSGRHVHWPKRFTQNA